MLNLASFWQCTIGEGREGIQNVGRHFEILLSLLLQAAEELVYPLLNHWLKVTHTLD